MARKLNHFIEITVLDLYFDSEQIDMHKKRNKKEKKRKTAHLRKRTETKCVFNPITQHHDRIILMQKVKKFNYAPNGNW